MAATISGLTELGLTLPSSCKLWGQRERRAAGASQGSRGTQPVKACMPRAPADPQTRPAVVRGQGQHCPAPEPGVARGHVGLRQEEDGGREENLGDAGVPLQSWKASREGA